MQRQLRPDQTALAWASGVTLVSWIVPFLALLTLPLVYLNTHIHELCHAIAGVISGGIVLDIEVHQIGSGETRIMGGMPLITGSAGYVGAALVGALLILNMRTPQQARMSLKILAFTLAGSMVLWVRGDAVGFGFGLFWTALLFILSAKLSDRYVQFATGFLGVQQCLNSAFSLFTLLQINAVAPDMHNDAKILQDVTGLPALFWALGWAAFSGLLIFTSVKGAWRK